jgi:hypothetical protein
VVPTIKESNTYGRDTYEREQASDQENTFGLFKKHNDDIYDKKNKNSGSDPSTKESNTDGREQTSDLKNTFGLFKKHNDDIYDKKNLHKKICKNKTRGNLNYSHYGGHQD